MDFLPPEFRPGLGPPEKVTIMPMPEAAVDEDDGVVFREHDVGAPGEILTVKTEAEAPGVEHLPDQDFRFRIAAPDTGHYPGSLGIWSVRLRSH